MDTPLGTVDGRRTPPTRRPSRSVGRSRRLVVALSLGGAAIFALLPLAVPPETASAQSQPPTPTIRPLPGSTYQPLPPTFTPTPRVLPPTPGPLPTSTRAPVIPPPGVRVTPPGAPAQVPAQGAAPGPAQLPSAPRGPAQVPAASSGLAQVPPRPAGASGKPAEIPAVGTVAPSAVPPFMAGLGLLLVATGATVRRR